MKIIDGFDNTLCDGLEHTSKSDQARQIAQCKANERGETVWLVEDNYEANEDMDDDGDPLEPNERFDPAALPSKQFTIAEVVRGTVNGQEWVAYTDHANVDVILLEEWERETDAQDYSLWCASTTTAPTEVYVELLKLTNDTTWCSGAHGSVSLPPEVL